MSSELTLPSIEALTRGFRRRTVSPVEIMRAAHKRIDRLEPRLNAFVHRLDESEAIAQASAAEERWRQGTQLGPLDGVPITVKDAIIAKGWTTMRGSRTAEGNAPDADDAPAVARLRAGGAIVIGKTTTPEFGWKCVTDSPLSGITRNPWNLDKTPGGSSGGSAAALAAGIGYAGIGTDAAGSVRIPGSFSGVVALKATVGRIPTFPPSAVGPLGHIGPLALTVRDTALLVSLMSQDDPRDWQALLADGTDYRRGIEDGVADLKIAYSPALGYAKVDPEVAGLVAKAAATFEALGAEVETIEQPFADPTEAFQVHFSAGLSHSIRNMTEERRRRLDPAMLTMIDRIGPLNLTRFLEAADTRAALGRTMREFHGRFDLLLTPTVAVPAFEAGHLSPAGWDQEVWTDWAPFTYPFNLTGQPALTVPCGVTESGLPVGFQIVGPLRGDALVLQAGRAYERTVPTGGHSPRTAL